jgi:hypothetical protein
MKLISLKKSLKKILWRNVKTSQRKTLKKAKVQLSSLKKSSKKIVWRNVKTSQRKTLKKAKVQLSNGDPILNQTKEKTIA